ncbi:hypothetical protein A3D03_00020 [Candidatus Gottesmanbacteria bacterium RIFCSPHIGHO2_02_FULL_40_13]|uniref:Probable endonuclease 4 n=1 Tax=Candidatus Gottesmanbacteria bacterium RIFCSPHIGHO2_02_FULL_40_13 TaxID=1798384 RepID=A0A1F6A9J6_9BACT|nr:MAG: hypothetical protein A3D03_00020 [Candidatus Gottesmanbacteria bacterium RIFCSPHIGHO2_02_FULL_40_13]
MLLGAHLSISDGLDKALINIHKMGGNCLQIFSASPRIWQRKNPSENQISLFLKTKKELRISPIYFHASYLINLAGDSRIGDVSTNNLIAELGLAAKLGVKGSIIHLGSYKEEKTPAKTKTLLCNIKTILDNTPANTFFIIENAGNRKIGQSLEEIGAIITAVNNPRLKVCLDTCHLHAAGYDLRSLEKLNKFISLFDTLIGLNRLELFHVNDSKDEFASLRDRHDNIGEGKIGLESFRHLLNHPDLKQLPFIIETPGFDGQGPDRKNLDILKSLI